MTSFSFLVLWALRPRLIFWFGPYRQRWTFLILSDIPHCHPHRPYINQYESFRGGVALRHRVFHRVQNQEMVYYIFKCSEAIMWWRADSGWDARWLQRTIMMLRCYVNLSIQILCILKLWCWECTLTSVLRNKKFITKRQMKTKTKKTLPIFDLSLLPTNIVIYFYKQRYFGKRKFSKYSIISLSQSLDLVGKLCGSNSVELVILFN